MEFECPEHVCIWLGLEQSPPPGSDDFTFNPSGYPVGREQVLYSLNLKDNDSEVESAQLAGFYPAFHP